MVRKTSPRCSTSESGKWTKASPSVWAAGARKARTSSPLKWKLTAESKVTTGRAPAAGCGEKRPPRRGVRSLSSARTRRLSWAKIQHVPPGERLVPADVVRVHVRVDQEADVAVRHAPHRVDQPRGQRLEQGIDEQHAVGPGKHTDVAASARPRNHVDLTSRRHDGQLDAREPVGLVLPPGADGDEHHAERGECEDDETGLSEHRKAPSYCPPRAAALMSSLSRIDDA